MNINKIILIFMIFSTKLILANTPIIKCNIKNPHWTATLSLDGVGLGLLKVKHLKSKKDFTCPLGLTFLQDSLGGVSPSIIVDFNRGECFPKSSLISEELFETVNLIIELRDKKKPRGRIQWLKKSQPDSCKITKFRLTEIKLNEKRWLKQRLNRATANQ